MDHLESPANPVVTLVQLEKIMEQKLGTKIEKDHEKEMKSSGFLGWGVTWVFSACRG